MFHYEPDVTYSIQLGDRSMGPLSLMSEPVGGRALVVQAMLKHIPAVLEGERVSIVGSDGSVFEISGKVTKAPPAWLDDATRTFFDSEIDNAMRDPDLDAATLGDARDSLWQADEEVIRDWLDPARGNDDSQDIPAFERHVQQLVDKYGGNCELQTLLDAHTAAEKG
jgi:hypothetical protein